MSQQSVANNSDHERSLRSSKRSAIPRTGSLTDQDADPSELFVATPLADRIVSENIASAAANATMSANAADISPATQNYLELLISNALTIFAKDLKEHFAAELKARDERIGELERRLNRSKFEIKAARIEIDNLQQYQRRRNIRIEGIETIEGETEEKLFDKIQSTLQEVDVNIEERDVIRFHRSAKPKT